MLMTENICEEKKHRSISIFYKSNLQGAALGD